MKKILWIPQLTTIDNYTHTITNSMNNIIDNLHDDYKFFIMLPDEDDNYNYRPVVSSNACIIDSVNQPIHAYALHYDFDFPEICQNLKALQPDIIINNFPALTRNVKTAIHLTKMKTKVISFLHSLEEASTPLEVSFFVRQMEGVLCADKTVFLTEPLALESMQQLNQLLPDLKLLINPYIDSEDAVCGYDVWDSIEKVKSTLSIF